MDAASNDGEVMKLKAKREKVEAKREKVEALLEMDDDDLPDAYKESAYKQWRGLSRDQLNDEKKQLSDEIKRLDERELAYLRAAPGKYASEVSLL